MMMRIFAAAAALAAALTAGAAVGQNRDASASEPGEALILLFDAARSGEGDPHLPFVLTNLKKALTSQDAIALLELVDPEYFQSQVDLSSGDGRTPGAVLNQFTCELLSLCDISKSYKLNDVISMQVLSATQRAPSRDAPAVYDVRIEMRLWDGVTVQALIFYDPAKAKLFGAVG